LKRNNIRIPASASPYLINKLKDEKIEKEELKKYSSNSSRVKITP